MRTASDLHVIRLVHEFEWCPADYIEESRRSQFLPEALPGHVWQSPRARAHLSRHILRTLGLESPARPAGPGWMFALLDADRLRRLALYVAAAVASAQVRACLLRDDVASWREWLSAAPFAFAQQTAPLLPLMLPRETAADRAGTAESLGMRWLARAALAWPAAVAGRFLLKLPQAESDQPVDADEALALRLAASVVAVVEPQWCSSLAAGRT
jgi:hypothetical protein